MSRCTCICLSRSPQIGAFATPGTRSNRVLIFQYAMFERSISEMVSDVTPIFMTRLVDGDLASNNGGWQWAASTGTDAQPYFRIFHPVRQGRTFDADGAYVRRWNPELAGVPAAWVHAPGDAPPVVLAEAGVTLGRDYPHPIVDHAVQRERALAMYRRT